MQRGELWQGRVGGIAGSTEGGVGVVRWERRVEMGLFGEALRCGCQYGVESKGMACFGSCTA